MAVYQDSASLAGSWNSPTVAALIISPRPAGLVPCTERATVSSTRDLGPMYSMTRKTLTMSSMISSSFLSDLTVSYVPPPAAMALVGVPLEAGGQLSRRVGLPYVLDRPLCSLSV